MTRKNDLYVLVIASFAVATSIAVASPPQDGLLDKTFSAEDGKLTINFDEPGTTGTDIVFDTVKDALGRTYIVGTVSTVDGERIGITRLDVDGEQDNSYGPDGDGEVIAPDEMGFNLSGVAAAMDPNGFLLVAGTVNVGNNNDFAVCRLNSDGELATFPGSDLSCRSVGFDLGGPGGADDDVLSDVLVQSNGKIVLVGSATANVGPLIIEGAIARLNSDATLDETFNGTGKQYFLPVQQGNLIVTTVRLNAAAIADNGKIVAVGSNQLEGFADHDPCIVRLTAQGELDESFSNDGFRSYVDVDSSKDARFNAVALMPRLAPLQLVLDQEIVAVGEIEKVPGSGTYSGLLARMQTSSAPDNRFSVDGFQVDAIGTSLSLEDVEPMYDHSITVAGTTTTQQSTRLFYAARFLTDGAKDTGAFNAPLGYTTLGLSTGINQDEGKALVFHDSRIVMAGTAILNAPDFDYGAVGLVRDRIFHDGVERLD
jgi:uncharacterized delta-60 repeat protein